MLGDCSTKSRTVAASVLMSAAVSDPKEEMRSPPFFGSRMEDSITSYSFRVMSRRVGLGGASLKMLLKRTERGVPSSGALAGFAVALLFLLRFFL